MRLIWSKSCDISTDKWAQIELTIKLQCSNCSNFLFFIFYIEDDLLSQWQGSNFLNFFIHIRPKACERMSIIRTKNFRQSNKILELIFRIQTLVLRWQLLYSAFSLIFEFKTNEKLPSICKKILSKFSCSIAGSDIKNSVAMY